MKVLYKASFAGLYDQPRTGKPVRFTESTV